MIWFTDAYIRHWATMSFQLLQITYLSICLRLLQWTGEKRRQLYDFFFFFFFFSGGGGGAPWDPLTLKSMSAEKGGSKSMSERKKGLKFTFFLTILKKGV